MKYEQMPTSRLLDEMEDTAGWGDEEDTHPKLDRILLALLGRGIAPALIIALI